MRPILITKKIFILTGIAIIGAAAFFQFASGGEKLSGELVYRDGIPILRLEGQPYDIGYAYGNLLAYQIINTFNNYIPILASPSERYSRIRQEAATKYHFSADELLELEGMLAGIKAELGAENTTAFTGEPFDLTDLKVLQTIPDWYPIGCASFVAWDKALAPEGVIAARNMDFMPHPALMLNHLLVYRKLTSGRSYMTMGWPGITGALTGVTDNGLFVAIHDSNADFGEAPPVSLPRMSAARMLLERASKEDTTGHALTMLKKHTARWGGLIVVAGDNPAFASIFEREHNETIVRNIDDKAGGEPSGAIYATNHFRKLYEPYSCWRYTMLTNDISENLREKESYTLSRAIEQMAAVRQSITLQTIAVNLKTLDLRFRFRGIFGDTDIKFTWDEISGKNK